jgi:Fe-S-cluster containining protein
VENLTQAEQRLFAKWYGYGDLAQRPEFWQDAYECFSKEEANIPLPIGYNALTVRMVLDMLDCQKCGNCCRYDRIPVYPHDLERIIEHTQFTMEDMKKIIVSEKGKGYLKGTNGCPFLKKNRCSIYKYRPDACYLFPIQSPKETTAEGKAVRQMIIRIKCPQTMEVAKKVIMRALNEGDRLLLPNLMVIEKSYKEENNGSD